MNSPYFFAGYLFEEFLRKFEENTGIAYTYNPMLILVEIKKQHCRGEIPYQNKMIIELDNEKSQGIQRSGQLFEAIFNIAKKEANLERFKKELQLWYLKGNKIRMLASILSRNHIEAVGQLMEGVMRYRIK